MNSEYRNTKDKELTPPPKTRTEGGATRRLFPESHEGKPGKNQSPAGCSNESSDLNNQSSQNTPPASITVGTPAMYSETKSKSKSSQ